MAAKQYRQGDVFLIAVDEIPSDVREVERDGGRVVLAYGEATGHAHAILDRDVTLWEQADVDARFLEIVGDEPVQLLHEEHSTIDVPPGRYAVVNQREYHPEAVRRVAD